MFFHVVPQREAIQEKNPFSPITHIILYEMFICLHSDLGTWLYINIIVAWLASS